jgi:hypothetical protein
MRWQDESRMKGGGWSVEGQIEEVIEIEKEKIKLTCVGNLVF